MIKSNVGAPTKKEEPPYYPVLLCSKQSDLVVLMTSYRTGVVVRRSEFHVYGDSFSAWDEDNMIPLKGTVVLENV